MSDELEKLEKAWDESKADPNISLTEMWERERKYREKKEEEDRIQEQRKEEQRIKEEEERRRKEQEHQRLMEMLAQGQQQKQSSSPYTPLSTSSTTNSDATVTHPCSETTTDNRVHEPTTILDIFGSIIGFIVVGAIALLPFLCLIYIKKVINAVSWLFSHWFCGLTWTACLLIILCLILITCWSIHTAWQSIKGKSGKVPLIGLYCLSMLVYFLVCRGEVQKGENLIPVIFSKLPILLYVPVGANLLILLGYIVANKKSWKFKDALPDINVLLTIFAVWGGFFLLTTFFKGYDWTISETLTALRCHGKIFAAVWNWFVTPLLGQ